MTPSKHNHSHAGQDNSMIFSDTSGCGFALPLTKCNCKLLWIDFRRKGKASTYQYAECKYCKELGKEYEENYQKSLKYQIEEARKNYLKKEGVK